MTAKTISITVVGIALVLFVANEIGRPARMEAERKMIVAQEAREERAMARAAEEKKQRVKEIAQLIEERRIQVGMTPGEVERSWGVPRKRIESGGVGGKTDTWHYPTGTLFFVEGKLARWTVEH